MKLFALEANKIDLTILCNLGTVRYFLYTSVSQSVKMVITNMD